MAEELTDKSAEDLIVYIARVSNPSNQTNWETAGNLIRYLIRKSHWSPFEHAFFTVEITTTRAIAAQILRHRSFTFQEFSQRYSEALDMQVVGARGQDLKNKQNSTDDLPEETKSWFEWAQGVIWAVSFGLYEQALKRGIAKECARFLLPLNTETTIYMTGSVRSWLHYIFIRAHKDTQLEHRFIAEAAMGILCTDFPNISRALTKIEAEKKHD